MDSAHMLEAFYDLVSHHLPPGQSSGAKGGRPRVAHRIALKVLLFIQATGNRREDVLADMGCSGRTAHRRLRDWEQLGLSDRLHADLLRPGNVLIAMFRERSTVQPRGHRLAEEVRQQLHHDPIPSFLSQVVLRTHKNAIGSDL